VRNLSVLSGDTTEVAIEQGAILIGMPLEAYGGVLRFLTVLLLVLSAWAVLLGVNVLGRRRWARDATISTFGLFALSLPLSIAGMLVDPPARAAGVGVTVGLVDVAIVVLLLRPQTVADFDQAWRERENRRHDAAGSRRR
jgi:hypothetical protein